MPGRIGVAQQICAERAAPDRPKGCGLGSGLQRPPGAPESTTSETLKARPMSPWVSTASDTESSRCDLQTVCKSECAQMRETLRRADPTCRLLLRSDLRALSTMPAEARRGVLDRLEGHRRDRPERSTAEVEAGGSGSDAGEWASAPITPPFRCSRRRSL